MFICVDVMSMCLCNGIVINDFNCDIVNMFWDICYGLIGIVW